MSKSWPRVKLGEVLRVVDRFERVDPSRSYSLLGVRLEGQGPFLRETVTGAQTSASRFNRVQNGDFIYSRLFAWRGAFGSIGEKLDGCFVSNEFPLFRPKDVSIDIEFLRYWFQLPNVWKFVEEDCTGSTPLTRNRYKEEYFLRLEAPLPTIDEQRRIVARIDAVQQRLQQADTLRTSIGHDIASLLAVRFQETLQHAEWLPMREVAPIVRRDVVVDHRSSFAELGIRCFGKGTFHKPTLSGIELGSKRVYRIEPGDLLFSNVFAWEGAIAVAKPEDAGRVGSHRFISCVPHNGLVTAEYLRYHFLTDEGMSKIRDASPGGAGRNRTLGLEKLLAITVPMPPIQIQQQFVALQAELTRLRQARFDETALSEAVVPALIARTMSG